MRWCGRAVTLGLSVVLAVSCTPRQRSPAAAPPVRGGPTAVAVLPFRMGGEIDPTTTFAERADMPSVPDVGARMATLLSAALARNGISTVDPSVVLQATPPPGAARYDPVSWARVARSVSAQLAIVRRAHALRRAGGIAWGASTGYRVVQAVLVDADGGAVLDREAIRGTPSSPSARTCSASCRASCRGRQVGDARRDARRRARGDGRLNSPARSVTHRRRR